VDAAGGHLPLQPALALGQIRQTPQRRGGGAEGGDFDVGVVAVVVSVGLGKSEEPPPAPDFKTSAPEDVSSDEEEKKKETLFFPPEPELEVEVEP